LPPADPAREKFQAARVRRLAENARLDPDFAERLLNFIIAEVVRHHEQIAADEVAARKAANKN
jgi:chorismate mutase